MNKYEKDEISDLPSKYRPMTCWAYLGYAILFTIPVLGWISVIVFSIVNNNINVRSFARFFLVIYIALAIILTAVILTLYFTGILGMLLDMAKDYFPQFSQMLK